jgi:hypothetical protein
MGRGKASQIALPTDLPSGLKYIQWRVENIDEVAEFLEPFVCRMRKVLGDQVVVMFPGGGSIQLSPGDCLVVISDGDREGLGVIHAETTPKYREIETLNRSHLEH